MSTTDIAVVDSTYVRSSLDERKAYAQALSAAGELVPSGFRDRDGKPNAAKVLLAFEYGAMVGLHPVASLQGINVIEGKMSPSPALMTALVRRAGHKLRIRKTGSWTKNDYSVTVTLIRADDPGHPFEETWDAERAKRGGLLPAPGPKSSWAKYPEAMCMWRATSAVCREGAEDVLFGLHYIPEELGADVNEAGDVIEGEIIDDEPGAPGDTGKRGHASETQVRTGPDKQRTPAGGSRPSPSRTVETSGAGRATPTQEPSEETRAAVANYLELIAAEDNIERLRDLHGDASTHGLLATPTGDGRRLNDVFYARRETLLQQQEELPPPLDGIEDDGA